MNDRETRRYDMFGRVQTFGKDNATDFAAGSKAAGHFAAVTQVIKDLDTEKAKQGGGMAEVIQLDAIMRNKYARNPDKLTAWYPATSNAPRSGRRNPRHRRAAARRPKQTRSTLLHPDQLFYSTQIPVCLWFLAKYKNADAKRGFRCKSDAAGEVRRKTEASPASPKKSSRYINSSTTRRHEKPLVQKSAISTIRYE